MQTNMLITTKNQLPKNDINRLMAYMQTFNFFFFYSVLLKSECSALDSAYSIYYGSCAVKH